MGIVTQGTASDGWAMPFFIADSAPAPQGSPPIGFTSRPHPTATPRRS
jgi:hypothetical protein